MTKEDKNTRYYIQVELRTRKIVSWGYGDKAQVAQHETPGDEHRIYLTRGQYNKLVKRLG